MGGTRRKLYINCDDLGLHQSVDDAVLELLALDFPLSVSLMMVGPTCRSAVQRLRSLEASSVGIHLTVTAEYPALPMSPLSPPEKVASLVDERGYFYRSVEELLARVKLDELAHELEQQICAAFDSGLNPCRVDGHVFFYEESEMGAEVQQIVAALAERYSLPCRGIAGRKAEAPAIHMIWDGYDTLEERFRYYSDFADCCRSEISELIVHPGSDAEAMSSFTKAPVRRHADYRYFLERAHRMRFSTAFELCRWSDG